MRRRGPRTCGSEDVDGDEGSGGGGGGGGGVSAQAARSGGEKGECLGGVVRLCSRIDVRSDALRVADGKRAVCYRVQMARSRNDI